MSKPAIIPEITAAGIAVDPRTLERVIPESRRPDGTVRKQIKIRPGYTPQEDVSRFRGTRQVQMDARTLPKGHIIGWTPPPAAAAATKAGLSKSAKKNEKRKEKRKEKREEEPAPKVKDSWEDEDEDEEAGGGKEANAGAIAEKTAESKDNAGARQKTGDEEGLADKLEKLEVR